MQQYSPEDVLENIKRASVYYQEIMMHIMQNKPSELAMGFMDNERNTEIATQIYNQLTSEPEKFLKINLDYANNVQKLFVEAIGKFSGHNVDLKFKPEEKHDRRFRDPAWHQNIYFDFIKQFYLLSSDWAHTSINEIKLDRDRKSYLEFFSQQFIDALSPSNFVFSNPEVIRESLGSGMKNIAQGMEHFLNDIRNSSGLLNISTTDKEKFRVGKNLAITEGKVIYQNDLMQLICYKPKEHTHEIPLLIIPPWINKYYILDLSPNNSMVRWLVDNNYQVFMISWVNPGSDLADKDFEDYISEGILEAIDQIRAIGYDKINVCGYCIGGTALAGALCYLKQMRCNYINSATFLTTLIDFAKPGDIAAFINQKTIEIIEKEVLEKGFLDGQYISNSFGLIRANDLVWSFFVNNYLLGKSPAAFDILYWNSDPSNLPAKMYLYYLKNMYVENNMIKPGGCTMLGKKIDISKIDLPTFSLAAKRDHIALWQGAYDSYKHFGGDRTFCLTDAGHVAGVVNPAENTKYSHHIGDFIANTAEGWYEHSTPKEGSWWKSWNRWLADRSGILKEAIRYDKLKEIEAAPGSYVKGV